MNHDSRKNKNKNSDMMIPVLPLPKRIPMPDDEQLLDLQRMGITIVEEDTGPDNAYVAYTLPKGWEMVDATEGRKDLPKFYIIDDESMIRVVIRGVWKGSYHNELSLYIRYDDNLEKWSPPAQEEKQFAELLRRYQITIEVTAGCGFRGQSYLDEIYRQIEEFVSNNPSYRDRMPRKHISSDTIF